MGYLHIFAISNGAECPVVDRCGWRFSAFVMGKWIFFSWYSPVDHKSFPNHMGSIQSGGRLFAPKSYLQNQAFGVTWFQHVIPRWANHIKSLRLFKNISTSLYHLHCKCILDLPILSFLIEGDMTNPLYVGGFSILFCRMVENSIKPRSRLLKEHFESKDYPYK